MPLYRILAERICLESTSEEGFLVPIPAHLGVFQKKNWSIAQHSADFLPLAEKYRTAGFFRKEINTFAVDWKRTDSLGVVDIQSLIPLQFSLPGTPVNLAEQRKFWAAINHGIAAGIDISRFVQTQNQQDIPSDLVKILRSFLYQEKTSPFRLGRLLFWNGHDAGIFDTPAWIQI